MKRLTVIVFFFILAALLIILVYNNYKLKKEIRENNSAYNSSIVYFSDSLSNLKQKITRYGDTLLQAKQTIMTLESALEIGLINQDDLNKKLLVRIQEITRMKEQISILSRPGIYTDTIEVIKDCVPFPFGMEFRDPNYFVKVTAKKDFPSLDSLIINSYPILTIGLQKDPGLKNIFQKPVPVVIYNNSNPFIKPMDIQSSVIYNQQKWYQTDTGKLSIGVVLGLILSGLLLH